jgi:hypothetical protein
MALLAPVLGNNTILGNNTLLKANSFVSFVELDKPFGIDIEFYSPSGEYVGHVGTTFDKSNLIGMELNIEKIGGLKGFKFVITRDIDIPFFNLMEVRIHINGNFWYTGELEFSPSQDTRDPSYEYTGKGYYDYFKQIKVNKLYENKTLEYMLNDIMENDISPNTPIIWNPGLIVPPAITVTKLELKKKTAEKAIEEILKIANNDYQTTQYEMGVDKNKQYYFSAIDSELKSGFFEGYQYQNPDVKDDLNTVINQIDIYRAVEDSQDVEFVSRVEDTDSQELYNIRNQDITISDFVDTTTAENIATAIIERNKDPFKTVSFEELRTNDTPFDIGFYTLNSKFDEYNQIINEFSDLTEWTQNTSNTTVTVSTDKVLTGKKSFKFVTASGSKGEYIEYTLDEVIYFPQELSVYVSQIPNGTAFNISVFDEDGVQYEQEEGYILQEGGDKFILEDGTGFLKLEPAQSGVEILVQDDFTKITYDLVGDVTSDQFILLESGDNLLLESGDSFLLEQYYDRFQQIKSIAKVRVYLTTDSVFTFYMDRLEATTESYNQNSLVLEKISYRQTKNSILANCEFGESADNILQGIKRLDDKQINTINIFQKS